MKAGVGLLKVGAVLLGALIEAGERKAVATVASFATKTAAREAVGAMGLSEAQGAAVRSAVGRATKKEEIQIISGQGGKVMVHLIRPGRDGFQVMQTVVKPDATKVVTQYGVSESGRVVIDPKNW